MAKFNLSACPTWRYRDQHGSSTMSLPLSRIGERRQIEARNLAEIGTAVASYGQTLATAHPDVSFSIFVSIAPRDRKPNGFDAANKRGALGTETWVQERDRDGNALPKEPAAEPAAA